MVQLILNGIILPETSKNKYRAYPVELSQKLDMISGRRVSEIRGNVTTIEWSYDYMGDDMCKKLLAVLRSGKPITAVYLPDDGAEMKSGQFWVQSLTPPSFAFSRGDKPFWHNIAFVLREVSPHD